MSLAEAASPQCILNESRVTGVSDRELDRTPLSVCPDLRINRERQRCDGIESFFEGIGRDRQCEQEQHRSSLFTFDSEYTLIPRGCPVQESTDSGA